MTYRASHRGKPGKGHRSPKIWKPLYQVWAWEHVLMAEHYQRMQAMALYGPPSPRFLSREELCRIYDAR